MREILFRGKRESDSKWLYGLYSDERVHETDFPCIFPLLETDDDRDWSVLPETVGQYIGVEDSKGIKIFEGDIVAYNATKYEVSESYGTFILLRVDGDVIDYNDFPQSVFRCGSDTTEFIGCCNDYCVSLFELSNNEQDFEGFLSCEIIGNIHDGCKGGE